VSTPRIPVGVLYDFPQVDGGASVEHALRIGFAQANPAVADALELRPLQVLGLPAGSTQAVIDGFAELEQAGVLTIIGPSISDNGVVVRDLADASELPCINYTGGGITRGFWMFHYQVGSLEEEPVVLAQRIAALGAGSAGVLYDDSVVGENYLASFRNAARDTHLEVTGASPVNATAEDVTAEITTVRETEPTMLCYLGLGVAARAVSLGLKAVEWGVPVVANSALMFGYSKPDWRDDWAGWEYVDTLADDNPERLALKALDRRTAAGPIGVAAYDIGRILGLAVSRCAELTREGLRGAFEQVRRIPAASGYAGTRMGFGVWDHGALKGDYLVLREWRDGRSVQV
jgi:branched-chain amino acid transport system substrate-binding protein